MTQPKLIKYDIGSLEYLRAHRDKLRRQQAIMTRNILALDRLIRITEARQ